MAKKDKVKVNENRRSDRKKRTKLSREREYDLFNSFSDLFEKPITRFQFLKYSAYGLGALIFGKYVFDRFKDVKNFYTLSVNGFNINHDIKNWKYKKEAYFYEKIDENVQCTLCPRNCIIKPNELSFCRTRINYNGKLYAINYSNPCALHSDPIEKKPFFHFMPGKRALSLAEAGCNLRCKYCQNWEISQKSAFETKNIELSPAGLVEMAKKYDGIIAYTYSEPIVFYEYVYDSSRLAKRKGLKNVVVSAGFINEKPLKKLLNVVDAIKIDLKAFNEEFYRKIVFGELDVVLRTIKTIHESGKHLEIVYLVVPGYNDKLEDIEKMVNWLSSIDPEIPLHFSRFHPDYKMQYVPPTPMNTLLKCYSIAKKKMSYVYIGNVPHGDYENTYCPKCKRLLVERIGYYIKKNVIKDGKCPYCGYKIKGIF